MRVVRVMTKGQRWLAIMDRKIIKELGLSTSKKVRFVVGTDEESAGLINYYFQTCWSSRADFWFFARCRNYRLSMVKKNIEYLHFAGEKL